MNFRKLLKNLFTCLEHEGKDEVNECKQEGEKNILKHEGKNLFACDDHEVIRGNE